MPSPLSSTGKIQQPQLDAYLKELARGPKDIAQQEVQKLLDAGQARLPEGAATKLRDALWSLQNDQWDPTRQSTAKRPPPAGIVHASIDRERALDNTGAQQVPILNLALKVEAGARVEVFNVSRAGQPRIWQGSAQADGQLAINAHINANLWHGDHIGIRVSNATTGAQSDMTVVLPKQIEVQIKAGAKERIELTGVQRSEAPFFQQNLMEPTHQLATSTDRQQHMVLVGKTLSVSANAKLEVVIEGQAAQSAHALPDGSFLLDVKGVRPGQQFQVRIIDGGQVSLATFNVPALTFDVNKLAASQSGVPYDRARDNQGPFMRFAASAIADPGSTVTISNFTTGKSVSAVADKNGAVNVEIAGVHAGDALGFSCQDAAGNVAQGTLEGWPVPGVGVADVRLAKLVCSNNLLGPQIDELSAIMKASPTSVNREEIEKLLAGKQAHGPNAVRDPADKERLASAYLLAFCGENDVRSNASNPAPQEPIVIGARVIKPRVMDQGNTVGRDPLEVEGKAEPFAIVEIRNASRQGSPVVGTVQADKNGDFKFVSRDESKFLHGDQLYVKATDQGGASSTSAVARTCAYELQIWNVQPRQQLVELPRSTDTRPPFIDMQSIKSERTPIGPNGKEQVFVFTGAAGSVEPNAVLRVVNQQGKTFEAASSKDGSFKLPVGDFTPGETLNLMVIDTNGLTAQTSVPTQALKLDHVKLTQSSSGVPYDRFVDGKRDTCGPFLDFNAAGIVDPHSIVVVKNNTTGKLLEVPADENGNIKFTLGGVHTSDSLTFFAADAADNLAPQRLDNYVVPAQPRLSAAMESLACQHEFINADMDKLIALTLSEPTAQNRATFDAILKKPDAFEEVTPALLDKLTKAIDTAYAINDVRPNSENPLPKRPIVLDADIIKPRAMDGGSVYGRDPLEMRGKAEPYSTVEVRNASQAGFPVIARIPVDAQGDWKQSLRDESKFLHGDQLLFRTVDQGGAVSKDRNVRGCAYELQIWNNPPRTEKVKLDAKRDTRPPFLDMSNVTHARTPATKDGKEQSYVVTGQAMASEPGALVRVTNGKGEAYETRVLRDGTFNVKVGNHAPGESLQITVIDPNGQLTQTNIATPALKFVAQALIDTSEGAPYVRLRTAANTERRAVGEGPFLRFQQDAAADAFSTVVIKNNSTGEEHTVQTDKNGRIDIEIGNVHTGDSLSIHCQDGAGNRAPDALGNYVVPGVPRPTARLTDIVCQQTVLKSHIDELVAIVDKSPTAANRGALEAWLQGQPQHTEFNPPSEKARVAKLIDRVFPGANDVRTDVSNPAPKEPIVLDARVIKPRVMDQGNAVNRDPVEVFGTAEPFTWIEVRNASMPGAPSLGRVQTNAQGDWKLVNRDESKFVHGDQLLIRATDQGGTSSKDVVTETCAYELQIWNQTNRSELVRLPASTDTRDPFIDMQKVKNVQTFATAAKPYTFTTLEGGALSAEPRTIIRVEGKNGLLGEVKVNDDGSFKLDVSKYTPGETLSVKSFDAAGRITTNAVQTQALTFDPAKMLANVDGPPFNKIVNGAPVGNGPFLRLDSMPVTFPSALLEITNHSNGKVQLLRADEAGRIKGDLDNVHAFDLLTFKVKDAAGNEAPNVMRAWQVPVESKAPLDSELVALVGQRPIDGEMVVLMLERLQLNASPAHRAVVDELVREHPDWFLNSGDRTALEKGTRAIFKGPPEVAPDTTNPAPKRPVILGAEVNQVQMIESSQTRNEAFIAGTGEPLSFIEVYNGSLPGRPKVGEVQVGEDGKFRLPINDAAKYQGGDQMVILSRDAGGQKSAPTVSRAKAHQVRIWQATGAQQKTALSDQRDAFLQTNLLTTQRADGTVQGQNSFVIVGSAGSTEVFGTVQVEIGAHTYRASADLDGAFKLPVPEGLVPGTPITILAIDANGRPFGTSYTPTV